MVQEVLKEQKAKTECSETSLNLAKGVKGRGTIYRKQSCYRDAEDEMIRLPASFGDDSGPPACACSGTGALQIKLSRCILSVSCLKIIILRHEAIRVDDVRWKVIGK